MMNKKKMQKGGKAGKKSKMAAKMQEAFSKGPMSQSMLSPKQKRKINRAAKKGPEKSPVKGPKMKGGGEALFKSLAGKMGKSKSMKLLEQMTKGGMMDMTKPMEARMGMAMDYMKRGGRVATNRKTKMMRGGMKGKKKL